LIEDKKASAETLMDCGLGWIESFKCEINFETQKVKEMAKSLLIKGGRVVDPSQNLDRVMDILIEDGKIARLEEKIPPSGAEFFDAQGLVVAPADGTIVVGEPYKGTEVQGEELLQVSIFLSLLDVHINRAPVSGLVEEVRYSPGRFKVAYAPEASLENERNLIRFASQGGTVWMKQIAGYLARRIVCRVEPGQRVEAGERIGLIRFGSRVDLLLPWLAAMKVNVGDRVKGGITVIALLPERQKGREGEQSA